MTGCGLDLNSLVTYDALACAITLVAIMSFTMLAARAQARMWRRVNRFDGERRALQHRITLGKSHLR